MMTAGRKKPGPEPDRWTDKRTHITYDMHLRTDGRFYPVGEFGDPNVTLGYIDDRDHAISKLRQWKASHRGEPLKLNLSISARKFESKNIDEDDYEAWYEQHMEPVPPPLRRLFDHANDLEAQQEYVAFKKEFDPSFDAEAYQGHIDVDYLAHLLRLTILGHSKELARFVNVPEQAELADRHGFMSPPKSLLLERIGQEYKNSRDITPAEKRKSLKWWKQFCKIVGVLAVKDITDDDIRRYKTTIAAKQKKNGHADSWSGNRYEKIKTIFNHAIEESITGCGEITRVKELCRMLKTPAEETTTDANPITVENFHALLEVADTTMKAIIMLGLNAAYPVGDIGRLPRSAVDYDLGTVTFHRTKSLHRTRKPIPRVARLDRRTIDALRAYQAEGSHNAVNKNGEPLLFANTKGDPLRKDTLTKWFAKLCEKAGIEGVTFGHLRDGAATHSGKDDFGTKVLMGHKAGQIDKYKVRFGMMVVDVCSKVIVHYFGDTSITEDGNQKLRAVKAS